MGRKAKAAQAAIKIRDRIKKNLERQADNHLIKFLKEGNFSNSRLPYSTTYQRLGNKNEYYDNIIRKSCKEVYDREQEEEVKECKDYTDVDLTFYEESFNQNFDENEFSNEVNAINNFIKKDEPLYEKIQSILINNNEETLPTEYMDMNLLKSKYVDERKKAGELSEFIGNDLNDYFAKTYSEKFSA